MKGINVAIDGPAGSGKSTIAKMLAKKMNMVYVDTGAMYRAIGYYTYQNCGLEFDFSKAFTQDELNKVYQFIRSHLDQIQISICYEEDEQHIILNEKDVSSVIRSSEIGNMASIISADAKVREFLVKQQQLLAEKVAVVMDGRDIGTHVLPDAPVKVFLTADSAVRARRRFDQLVEKGEAPDYETLKREIEERDYRDMNRENAPLVQAEDAVLLDSSTMTIEEVVDAVYRLIKEVNECK